MAIQFNANALSRFLSVNLGDDKAIANLGGENNLVQKDKPGLLFRDRILTRLKGNQP